MAYKSKTITKMWDQVFGQADKLRDRIHKLAVVTLDHYRQHGDTSLMAYAVNGMQKRGVHRRALIQWFQKYGRVQGLVQGDVLKFQKRPKADHTTIDIDKANASPFYDDDSVTGQTGEDLKSFNLFGRIRSAVKKAREIRDADDLKAAGYDPEKTVLGDDDVLAKLEEFVETYGNLDKPLPKNDRTVFRGSHGADANLKAVEDDTPQAATA